MNTAIRVLMSVPSVRPAVFLSRHGLDGLSNFLTDSTPRNELGVQRTVK